MSAIMTEWQKRMEAKIDKLTDAITGEKGTNVRLAVLETEVGAFKGELSEIADCLKKTTDSSTTNGKDLSGIKTAVGIHWALLLLIISGLIGIAFKVFS